MDILNVMKVLETTLGMSFYVKMVYYATEGALIVSVQNGRI